MLEGIDPILSGDILLYLDQMGHSDSVVIADAHFPARRLAARFVDLPTLRTPEVLRAVRTVIPLDEAPAMDVMATPEGEALDIHRQLALAGGVPFGQIAAVNRVAFYERAAEAFLIIRTGEMRTYANVLLRKGVVGRQPGDWTGV